MLNVNFPANTAGASEPVNMRCTAEQAGGADQRRFEIAMEHLSTEHGRIRQALWRIELRVDAFLGQEPSADSGSRDAPDISSYADQLAQALDDASRIAARLEHAASRLEQF